MRSETLRPVWPASDKITVLSKTRTETLAEALRLGQPEIFNTDQGAQFTSEAFPGRLEQRGIRVSMDGRGRALDNVFTERLWRSVQYEEVYWKEYREPAEAQRGLRRYFRHYNHERPHQALGYRTPAEVHATGVLWKTEARETEASTELSVSGSRGC